jgi:hypothetical protein
MREDLNSLANILERVETIGNHASDPNINELTDLIYSEQLRSTNSNPDLYSNAYLSDLKNTEYALNTLLENRTKPKNRESYFQNVIMHFKHDLINEINRIESSINI